MSIKWRKMGNSSRNVLKFVKVIIDRERERVYYSVQVIKI